MFKKFSSYPETHCNYPVDQANAFVIPLPVAEARKDAKTGRETQNFFVLFCIKILFVSNSH